jgi:hypothetical protein
MDAVDDAEDSRTSMVARKRDLGDFESRADSPDLPFDEGRSCKHAKQTHGDIKGLGVSGSYSLSPGDGPSEAQAIPSLPSTSWNQGVKGDVRTSFGSKPKKPLFKSTHTALYDDASPRDSTPSANEVAKPSTMEMERQDKPSHATPRVDLANFSTTTAEISGAGDIAISVGEPDLMVDSTSSGRHDPLKFVLGKQSTDFTPTFTNTRNPNISVEVPSFRPEVDAQPEGISSPKDTENVHVYKSKRGRLTKVVVEQASLKVNSADNDRSTPSSANELLVKSTGVGRRRHTNEFLDDVNEDENNGDSQDNGALDIPPEAVQQDSNTKNKETEVRNGRKGREKKKNKKSPSYACARGEFSLREMLQQGVQVPLENLTFRRFAYHFANDNAATILLLKPKQVKSAFLKYITEYFPRDPKPLLKAASDSADEPGWAKLAMKIMQTAASAYQEAASMPEDPEIGEVSREMSQERETPTTSRPGISQEESENTSVPEEQSQELSTKFSELELSLQQKYFPAVNGIIAKSHCLKCGKTEHRTFDCPAWTCTACGGSHTSFSCPKNRRCGKCREKGHHVSECTERLAASRDEMVCDLCQSKNHIETACHLIWRTFSPKSEEIKKVRVMTISCYFCGGDGHYGPECGLNRDAIPSTTWSRSNHSKYVENLSNTMGMSRLGDNSFPPRNMGNKSFSIKGLADNPITLDDSDEDVSFIRPKINGTTRHSNIKIDQKMKPAPASIKMSHDVIRTSSPRPQNLPARPDWARESARYGRERAFTPPPIDHNAYGNSFTEHDQYKPAPQQNDRSMNGYYPPPATGNSYNDAPLNGYYQGPPAPPLNSYQPSPTYYQQPPSQPYQSQYSFAPPPRSPAPTPSYVHPY